VNVPMGGDWSLRASGMVQRQDDRVHNPLPNATSDLEGFSDKAARVQASYKNGGFNALFKLQGRDYDGHATTFRANIMKRGTNDLVDGFDAGNYPTDGYNYQRLKSTAVSARLRWDFDTVSLHSITGYDKADYISRGDVDGGFGSRFASIADGPSYPGQAALVPFDAQTADGVPKLTQLTQEFRLQSTTRDALQWIAGAYYFKEDLQVDSFNYDSFAAGDPQNGYAVQHQYAKSWALFGNVNYALSPDFKVRAGVRYTDDQKDFDASRTQHPFLPNIAPVTAQPEARPTGAGTWAPTTAPDKSTALSSAAWPPATAHRPSRAACCSSTRVRRAGRHARRSRWPSRKRCLSVEAGFKADLLNNTRCASAARCSSYRVKDLQLTAGSGAVNQNRLVNADKAEGQRLRARRCRPSLRANWRTTLGLSYNDTEIKDGQPERHPFSRQQGLPGMGRAGGRGLYGRAGGQGPGRGRGRPLRPRGRHAGHFHFAEKKGYSRAWACTAARRPASVIVGLGARVRRRGPLCRGALRHRRRKLSVISCYFPSGSSGEERQAAKFRFLA
jgi:iron complex outermembrane receptor protein